jgi:RNA polymerase sigma-70 factor, ECF subfamily
VTSPTTTTSRWEAPAWQSRYTPLVRYATSLLGGDRHAAEDVVQETMLRYWQRAERLQHDDAVQGWLRTVARHLVIDRSRRAAVRRTEVRPDPAGHLPAATSEDPGDRVLADAATRELLTVLAPHHRDVVVELYLFDRSVAETAHRLGIPVGTVKSRCHHALRILRRHATVPDGV